MSKRYDREYFERWYRDPRTRVDTPAALARKARLALSAAEHLLGRPVRRVLDVGCGEGAWGVTLRRLRPRLSYVGVDDSAYAVARFGTRRNIRRGSVGALGELGLRGRFDLVVCCDVLHYVPTDELARGVPALAELLGDGVAYVELFTSADDIEGDLLGFHQRPPSFYRRLFRRAGLAPRGLHCWVGADRAGVGGALERG